MMNAQTKTSRIYFAVLFAALALDLAGRMQSSSPIQSHDLASTSSDAAKQTDTDCAKKLVDGRVNSGSEGQCTLEYSASKVESVGKVKLIQRQLKDNKLDWQAAAPSAPVRPAPIETRDCSKINSKRNPKDHKACLDQNKATEDRNAAELRKYNAELDAYNKATTPKSETAFELVVESRFSESEDCADCVVSETIYLSKDAKPTDIATKIRETANKQRLALLKEAQTAKTKKENEDKKRIADERLQKDRENCVRGEDGKAMKTAEATTCLQDRLASAEGKEAREIYGRLQSRLKQSITEGTAEERRQALSVAEEISKDSGLPRDVRDSAKVMKIAGKYQSQISSVSEQLAKAPEGSQARMFHMQRLAALSSQMELELGMAGNSIAMRGGLQASAAMDELMDWRGILSNSMAVAMQSPEILGGNSLIGRRQLGLDINVANRTARGPGATFLTQQSQFDGLSRSNAHLYIDQQIARIGQAGSGFTIPGSVQGLPAPGSPVSPNLTQNGLPFQQNTLPAPGTGQLSPRVRGSARTAGQAQ